MEQKMNEPSDGRVSGNGKVAGPSDLALPPLTISAQRSKFWFQVCVIGAIMDLGIMPIVYFYAFKYGTTLSLQDIFAIITGIFGMFCFAHYFFRSLRLFLRKKLVNYGPIDWTKWGLLEFLHVNIAIIIFLVEVELDIGTIPNKPILRLCAMTSVTVCYYLGLLFLTSSILSSLRRPMPFNMSSTPKGSTWRPALYGIIEDFVAIEMNGKRAFRRQLAERYQASFMFRRMIAILSWCWGVGFVLTAIAATVLAALLPDDVVFGVGWGLPYVCAAVMAIATTIFVKWSLRSERKAWMNKRQSGVSSFNETEGGVP